MYSFIEQWQVARQAGMAGENSGAAGYSRIALRIGRVVRIRTQRPRSAAMGALARDARIDCFAEIPNTPEPHKLLPL